MNGRNQQGGLPRLGMKPPNPEDCRNLLCTFCDCPSFIRISLFKHITPIQMPPSGGHLELPGLFCTNCQQPFDMERAKKWSHLTPEERAKAREQMADAAKSKAAKEKKRGKIITP